MADGNDSQLPGIERVLEQVSALRLEELARAKLRIEINEALIAKSPNGLVVIDQNRNIIMVNPSAESMFGYSSAELLGKTIEILVPDDVKPLHPAYVQTFIEDARVRPMGFARNVRGRRKSGTEFPAKIMLGPFSVSTGVYYFAIITQPDPPVAIDDRSKTVLLVEDMVEFAAMFVKGMATAGYVVEVAVSGEIALDMMRAKSFAFAVIDLTLPGMSGIELATTARAEGYAMPLIAISGDIDGYLPEDIARGQFVATIGKPLRISEIVAVAENIKPQTTLPPPKGLG